MMPRWQRSQKGRVCNMRYHNITKDDMLNGDGLRVVLWVAGCAHGCKECQNPVTWDPDGGLLFEEEAKKELFEQLEEITELAKEIRQKFPEKTQWLYTGYEWSQIQDEEIVSYLDVIVDGKFEAAQKDTKLHWKGSANQKVIDVQNSLNTGKIVLHDV